MQALVETTADPCHDFYQYACGGFEKSASLRPDQLEFAYAWDSVSRNNTRRLQPIIADSDTPAGIFYRSCMNTSAIEALGLSPLSPFVRQIEAIKDLVSLTAVIYWLHKANIVVFYDWSVEVNPHDPSQFALYLMQGGITLPSTEFYTSDSEDMQRKRQGYTEVATKVLSQICSLRPNCTAPWPARAAAQSLKIETDLANLFATPEEQRVERAELYTITNLTALAPELHLRRFINAMAGTYHSEADTIAGKIAIMIRNPRYFARASAYLARAGLEEVKSYLLFRLGFVLGSDLDARLEDTGFVLQRIVTGQAKKVPRWKKCMHDAMNALPGDVGRLYVEHFFSLATKEAAEHMVLRLKMAFRDTLQRAAWMRRETRAAALHKLHAMFFAVGAPSHFRAYAGPPLAPDRFLWNGLQLSEWYIHESFQRLTRAADRRRWGSTSPTMADAFYSYTDNGLFVPAGTKSCPAALPPSEPPLFPAAHPHKCNSSPRTHPRARIRASARARRTGILQPPFFAAAAPPARNYGHLGAIIGHEMTHGFDDQARPRPLSLSRPRRSGDARLRRPGPQSTREKGEVYTRHRTSCTPEFRSNRYTRD